MLGALQAERVSYREAASLLGVRTGTLPSILTVVKILGRNDLGEEGGELPGLLRIRPSHRQLRRAVSEYGFASSYQSVQRFVRKLRGAQTPEARVVIVTAPGQDVQVDYGTGPRGRDPETVHRR